MSRRKTSPIGCIGIGLGILWLNAQCGKTTAPQPTPTPYRQPTAAEVANEQKLRKEAEVEAKRLDAAKVKQERQERQRQEYAQKQAEERDAQARFDQIRSQAGYNSSAIRGTLPPDQQPGYALQQQRQGEFAQWRAEQAGGGSQSSGRVVYITRTGTHYHAQGCRHAGQAQAVSLESARASGLTSCDHCGGGLGL